MKVGEGKEADKKAKNRVVIYPIPVGAAKQRDYIVKVRPLGEEQWQEVGCYQVKVDMHDVRIASMAYFDFQGAVEVEITFAHFYSVYRVDIRPLALNIMPTVEAKRVTFVLDKPVNLSVEFNKERFHNLHLFAGEIEEKPDKQKGSYLGKAYHLKEIESYLKWNKYPFQYIEEEEDFFCYIARMIEKGKVIGLFQGRMEFGPRALGNRSIIADARSKEMQSKLNLKIKFRESFRPFAPSVLRERVSDYFELDEIHESPYMLMVEKVRPERRISFDLSQYLNEKNDNLLPIVNQERSDIPAITHVDYSARIQTVDEERNPFYYRVIKAFEKLTGCGVIVNTSFNVRGEPIVCTPKEAYECFMRTNMDILVLERFILKKEEQPRFVEDEDWREKYELD